jgi:HSP20 family protein
LRQDDAARSSTQNTFGCIVNAKEDVMNLIRYEPASFPLFRDMEDFSERLNRFFGGRVRGNGDKESLTVTDWMPAVDIQETDTEYLLNAEMPGVHKEDVKVTVENGVLTMQGERKQEKEEQGKKFHRIERSYGTFVRTFTVPMDAEENKVAADFKDGILKVHLPKTEKPRPKSIEVKVA